MKIVANGLTGYTFRVDVNDDNARVPVCKTPDDTKYWGELKYRRLKAGDITPASVKSKLRTQVEKANYKAARGADKSLLGWYKPENAAYMYRELTMKQIAMSKQMDMFRQVFKMVWGTELEMRGFL